MTRKTARSAADNYLMPYHQRVPCRKREALYELDGLLLHGTELDPKTCFTDTHGYTAVIMATALLSGFALVRRIADMPSCTLYRFDKNSKYQHLELQLRAEGHQITDAILSHITPLIWKHINPFGQYHFDLDRMTRSWNSHDRY